MREIKFRAWWTDTMYTVYEIDWTEGKINVLGGGQSLRPWVEDCTLMQYTGLKDKNGKEIYEGDIVEMKYTHSDGDREEKVSAQPIVKWDDCTASFYCDPIDEDEWCDDWQMDNLSGRCAIIGNIHENPELLNT